MNLKVYLLMFLTTILSFTSFGQTEDSWRLFWNNDTTLIGYKDKSGLVKIAPKFSGFTTANRFDHIIAATEEHNGTWSSYYLTKHGRMVGSDSLYIFDNGSDCESEGFIRFRDAKTDKVGLFNRNGEIAISAVYSALTNVRNGMIAGLKDAKKEYWSDHNEDGCNHYSWVGGQEVLIDTLNNLLVTDFSYDNPLDFFSIEKTNAPHPDTVRKSFLANDGLYYAFVDFEKEFKQWITRIVADDLTLEKLNDISYDTITWESKEGWAKTNKEKLIKDNFTLLKNGLAEILLPQTDYFISNDGLNPFMYDGPEFEQYFNNCGEAKDWKYPTMSIVVSHRVKKDFTQNHYEFLRTDQGYKLISLTIRNAKIK